MGRLSQDPANLAPFIVTPAASTQARRVQSANTNAQRPNTVEKEIGNETVVGISFDSPDVTLPIDANLVNARLISLFANFISFQTASGEGGLVQAVLDQELTKQQVEWNPETDERGREFKAEQGQNDGTAGGVIATATGGTLIAIGTPVSAWHGRQTPSFINR